MGKPPFQTAAQVPLLTPLPGWIGAGRGEISEPMEAMSFRSGAALAHLGHVAAIADLPHALWRDRLALAAAEACVRQSGRREDAGALRDALHLTKAGDDPGPAGRILRQWTRTVARPISLSHLGRALEGVPLERIALCLDATGPTPVDRAAQVIEAVLTDSPREETAALILGDAVLARSVGWDHVLPILSPVLTGRDLRLRGDALRLACHRGVVAGVARALTVAGHVARGAVRLRAVAPQLRAKTAARAVEMFLSRDALAPGALDFMSDRAARRLCDRLVSLGAVRELTGRDTFRLYGV